MRTFAKLGMTAVVAAVLFASLATAASARSLSTTEQGFRVNWSSLEFTSEIVTIRCRVTLAGSFHTRTIAKVARSLIGYLTSAIVAHPCTNGEAWADNGTEAAPLGTLASRLPWHVTYESFTGTLPNITGITLLLRNLSFVQQAVFLGITCRARYGSTTDNPSGTVARDTATGNATTLSPGENARASLVTDLSPGFRACPASGGFTGTGQVFAAASTTRIRITLI